METLPAVEEYRRKFPSRRQPRTAVFSSLHQRLWDAGSFATRESSAGQRVHEIGLLRRVHTAREPRFHEMSLKYYIS